MGSAIHCVICGSSSVDLEIYPHLVNGKMVGFLFCCPYCKDSLYKIKIIKEN